MVSAARTPGDAREALRVPVDDPTVGLFVPLVYPSKTVKSCESQRKRGWAVIAFPQVDAVLDSQGRIAAAGFGPG